MRKKKKDVDEGGYICCLCEEEHGLDDLHNIKIKKQPRKICKECVDTVRGLV